MKLKSYFSGTVEAAMELARKELGDEALLINARPSTPETRSLGAYEVVFGIPPKSDAAHPAKMLGAGGSNDRISQDVADLKREMERFAQMLRGAQLFGAPQQGAGGEIYERMREQEVDAELANRVAQGTAFEDLFEVDATIGRKGGERAVIAVVGPPGVGKTTTLVKLAARYGLAAHKPAHIISTDVYRIAAADQLRSLASILGIGCDVVETPVGLAQALEEHRTKELILIDTPGLARNEMEDGAELAHLISSHPEIDTHLVLPASWRARDMARVTERYSIFQPAKLLFTRMDETECFGPLVSEAARSLLPISFLSHGQQIPDDLDSATKSGLAALILGSFAPSQKRSVGAAA